MSSWKPPGGRTAVTPIVFVPLTGVWIAGILSDLALVAYFVAAEAIAVFGTLTEVALDRFSRATLHELADREDTRPRVERFLKREGGHLLTARLLRFLGNSLLVVGIAFVALGGELGGTAASDLTTLPWGTVFAVLAISFGLTFLVNDVLVRLVAARKPDEMLLRLIPSLEVAGVILIPLRTPLIWFVRVIFQRRIDGPGRNTREEVLETVEEGEREGSLSKTEADMIESIMDLEQSAVRDVMTARADIIMIQADATLADAVAMINEEGVSRLPVYGEDRDDVVGVLYARDLIAHWKPDDPNGLNPAKLPDLMRKPFFVPENKPVNDLLAEMRARKVHLAVVLDEFNGTTGLITIEDVLEEIVGEIHDEYDEDDVQAPPPTAEELASGTMDVDGRTPIEDVNKALSVELPVEDDFETMGGLVFHRLGTVPRVGDTVHLDEVELTVLEADERTVKKLKVQVSGGG